jgi:hypothetical protein
VTLDALREELAVVAEFMGRVESSLL